MAKQEGAWVPWSIAEQLPRLNLKPASHWQVFLVVLLTWCRYGCGEARLGVRDIADMTGLSTRTVQTAVSKLIAIGLLKRLGRYRRLAVDMDVLRDLAGDRGAIAPHTHKKSGAGRSASKLASPKGNKDCVSPICINVFNKESNEPSIFTSRQLAAIQGIFADASELLDQDSTQLPLAKNVAEALGLAPGTSYAAAFASIRREGDAAQAHRFTGAVFALRND